MSNKCDECKLLVDLDKNDKTAYCTKGFLPKRMFPFEFGCIYFKKIKNDK